MNDLLLILLAVQAMMGAFDTVYHHELSVALPRAPGAARELAIHAVRAMLYGTIFAGLAWFAMYGYWAWLLAAVFLIEILLTLWDFVIEDRTRLLPASERITHTLLAINGGAIGLLLVRTILTWADQDTSMVPVHYGWATWFLSLAAAGVFISGIRDGLAAWANQRLTTTQFLDLGGHKRVLVSGATGFIGSVLCRELIATGHDITVISRQPHRAAMQFHGRVRAIASPHELSADAQFDVIINLAGAPVIGLPWTRKRKQVLLNSRINTTRHLLDFVKRVKRRPATWIQTSAIGFYGSDSNATVDEQSSVGAGFAGELCKRWELETAALTDLGVRCVILRLGLIFGRCGGALPLMVMPFRFGLGSILGGGGQFVSWMHLEDLLALIALAIRNEELVGIYNAVAPEATSYRDFARMIGRLLYRPVWLRIPTAPLKLTLGEMADMLVEGPRVIPGKLQEQSFEYQFPSLRSALMDLL